MLGDVRGRGVEAATTALLIRHVIRSAAVNLATPAAILAHLNDVLLHQEGEEDEPRFATAVLAIVRRTDSGLALTIADARQLPMDGASAGAARSYVSRQLTGRVSADTLDVARLLVSELVTNAVRYRREPVTLSVAAIGSEVRVTVSDADPTPPRSRDARPTDLGGRGLQLVEALSVEWGHDQHEHGKDVWFVIH